MSFFENIGKKAVEVAQSAAKKSGEMVETTKLSFSIKNEEDKIEKNLIEIGKVMLSAHRAGEEVKPEIKMVCESIKASEEIIVSLKEKILEVKNIKACTGCGMEIERTTLFCAGCGAKQEMAVASQDSDKFCAGCGKKADDGQTFCSGCGGKL